MSVIGLENVPHSTIFQFGNASFGKSSFDQSDVSRDDEECLTAISVTEMAPGQSNHAACWLTATRFHLNSLSEEPKNWGRMNPNLNHYHSDPMVIGSPSRLADITDWGRQQEETHSKYADLSNVARNIFSSTTHGIRVRAGLSLWRDIIGGRQSETTGERHQEKVVAKQFTLGNTGILEGVCAALDNPETENNFELKQEVEER